MFVFQLMHAREHRAVAAARVGGRGARLARPRTWACKHGCRCGGAGMDALISPTDTL
jgi:hypothetical protein